MQITSVPDGRPLSSAGAPPRGAGSAPVTDSHRGTGTGGSSAPHFPVMPLLATNNATMPTAFATTSVITGGPTDGAMVTAASAADTGMDATTDATPLAVAHDAHASSASVDIDAVATSSVIVARKRKGRSKQSRVAQDERKRQRRAALLLTTQGNTEAGT